MKSLIVAAAGGLLLASGVAVFAHSGAQGIVLERMEMMKDIAAQTKTVALMVRGRQEFDAGRVAEAGTAISEHAKHIPAKFPEGSKSGPSEASAAIWENWDGFVDLSRDFAERAEALANVAAGAADVDAIRPAFQELAGSCRDCHEQFREPG